MTQPLLVATRNEDKVKEISEIISELDIQWLSLDDLEIELTVAEIGNTFETNAIIKAEAYAATSGMLTLADDSGLEVDALDGRPGVLTARYGGASLSPVQRFELLLEEMRDVPWESRDARFRCVVALASPEGLIGTASGVCEGIIALEPVGSGGFGYDPIFFLPEMDATMAQLMSIDKHRISHRGRALAAIAPMLRKIVGNHS
jgi:XTP/dITP diphosphohydrolase